MSGMNGLFVSIYLQHVGNTGHHSQWHSVYVTPIKTMFDYIIINTYILTVAIFFPTLILYLAEDCLPGLNQVQGYSEGDQVEAICTHFTFKRQKDLVELTKILNEKVGMSQYLDEQQIPSLNSTAVLMSVVDITNYYLPYLHTGIGSRD